MKRNLFTHYGEIDILGRKGNTLMVLEVRGRGSGKYPPHRFLSRQKLERLRRLASWAGACYRAHAVKLELVEVIGPRPRPEFERLAALAPGRFGLSVQVFPIGSD